MTSSAQLERHADRQRERIVETLDELRGRLTPGQIVDQVSDYVSAGTGGAFLRNLRAQCIANPVPVAFMGAGLAWLMLSGFRERRGSKSKPVSGVKSGTRTVSDEVSRNAAQTTDKLREAAGQFGEQAGAYGEDARRASHDLRDSVSGAAKSGYEKAAAGYDHMSDYISDGFNSATEQAKDTADSLSRKASQIGASVASAGSGLKGILLEQPLVLAGFGLAIGALLGAYLPTTELENKVMGGASDKLKEKVRDTATDALDKGKAVGERVWQEAREAASEENLLPLDEGMRTEKQKPEDEASLVPQEGGGPLPGSG
jgi:hypothetical protein